MGAIITGAVSAILILLSFFGQNTGNFVISVDNADYYRGLILCEEENFTTPTSRLLASPAFNVRDVSYNWLKFDEASKSNGDYFDPDFDYLAYTFYMKNDNEITADYEKEAMSVDISIKISSVRKNVDDAIRVLVVEDDKYYRMYMKHDEIETVYPFDEGTLIPEIIEFESDTVVMRQRVEHFRPMQTKKYTVYMWIEGDDPECTIAIQEGKIKMDMVFRIANIEE